MRIHRTQPAPLRRLVLLVSACLLVVLSCGREVTAPVAAGVRWVRGFSFSAVFPTVYQQVAVGGSGIQFERVHIVLRRADGSIAKDTTVLFPVGVDELPVSLNVPLSPGAPASGELMSLNLDYVNAANQVVFSGGPVTVTATPSLPGHAPPPPVQVPVRYSGPGASAARVVASPRSLTVFEGQGFSFTAVATDASGATIPNTPIFWTSLDPTIASVAAPGAGAGAALAVRGTARVVAQLLTGPKDTVTVQVLLQARTLALQSGNAQAGMVGTALAQPLVVKAMASDGVGVAGVGVTFAVALGGGSVGSSTVTTDASGLASTPFTLGPTTGTQTVTASADGLAGSPLTFTATARSVAPVRLAFTAGPPVTVAAGAVIGPLTVSALDAQGDVATTFAGTVTIALGTGAPSAPLLGTLTAAAVAGVANFGDLRLNLMGSGYTLAASASGLTGVTSDAFAVIAGPAQRIAFGSYPITGATAGVPMDPIQVFARDAAGNIATSFTGTVTLDLLQSPAGVTLAPSLKTVAAVGGVATFNAFSLTQAGQYRFVATVSGLAPTNGPPFPVVAGPAGMLTLISGSGQTANAGTPLERPIVVGASDRFGNPVYVAGRTINFAASNGGSASPASATTNAAGQVSTTWTLGGTPGLQTFTASSGGLSLGITATAIGGSSGTMTVFGGNNQYAVANTAVLTPPSVIVKDGANNPLSGVSVTFTPSAGSSITGSTTVASGANGIAAVGGWTLGASGSYTLTASATGYANVVFTATVNTVPMSVTAAEKQPNGTQQFSVTGGNLGDTYTWSVNNTAGGNSTFGFITSTGFYTAPETVPTPATFAVCAQSVQTPANKGCINVTISSTPTAGGELIVINDINWGDDTYGLGSYGCYPDTRCPGNVQFVKNIVNFTPAGSRRGATKVLLINDVNYPSMFGKTGGEGWSTMASIIQGEGYTPVDATLHTDLANIPADVKVVMLVMPGTSFPTSELNGLKTFASQGGRIIFFGENSGYYSYGLALENTFLSNMGAVMTNTGACDAPGVIVNSVAHQLTAGISANGTGGFYMNCVSHMNLGPNDFALMNYGGVVVAAIAKIDLTLLPLTMIEQSGFRSMTEQGAGAKTGPMGLPGWTSTGPPPP